MDSLFGDPHWLLLRVTRDSDLDVLTMGNTYHESSIVNFARASMVLNFQFFGVPSDEYWQYQWNFQNVGQTGGTPDADIDLELAYDYFQSPSAYVTVALLDDGFVPHEDFPLSRLVGGWDYASDDPDFSPGQLQSHGMSCLGLIAADTGSSTGVSGISYNARIIGQKITNNEGALTASDGNIARAFSDAVLAGAKVISNSWGCDNCDPLYPLTPYWIRMSDSLGAVVVFSAGNFGAPTVVFPGNVPEVISVGATDKNDSRWIYSSFGNELDVVAPSGDIQNRGDTWTLDQMGNLGSVPIGMTCDTAQGNYNCKFGGTSAACPQVAGVVAMLLRRRPDLIGNTEQIRKIIRYSSERTPFGSTPTDTARVNNSVGWGRLNAARALLSVVRGDANNSGTISISDAVRINEYIFNGGPAPYPHLLCGDADGNGAVSISDVVKIVQYLFAGGSAPPISFKY